MENSQRDFKGVWIPKEIWLDKRLNALEKVILTEIDSLDCGEKGCWASNKHLAEFCQCSESAITKAISKLIEYDYIYLQSFDGRIRNLRSRLVNFTRQSSKFYEADCENLRVSNTKNNKDSIYNNGEKLKKFVPPTLQDVKEYCLERKNNVNPERFIDFYESKGWFVGKNKMKDWKACVRTWEKTSKNNSKTIGRSYTEEQFNNMFDNLDEVEL